MSNHMQTQLRLIVGVTPEAVFADRAAWALMQGRSWRRRAAFYAAAWPAEMQDELARLDTALRDRRLLEEDEIDLAHALADRLDELVDGATPDELADEATLDDETDADRAEDLAELAEDLRKLAKQFAEAADLKTTVGVLLGACRT